jgi:hypothetical protein
MRAGVRDPAGPDRVGNHERFVNDGKVVRSGLGVNLSLPTNAYFETLILVNGRDDNGNGYVDESFDGLDNDGDGITDPGYNGLDDNGDGVVDEFAELAIGGGLEFEPEQFQDARPQIRHDPRASWPPHAPQPRGGR